MGLMRPCRFQSVLVAVLLCIAALPGCGSGTAGSGGLQRETGSVLRDRAVPKRQPVLAFAGRALVAELDRAVRDGPVDCVLDDGRSVRARVVRVRAVPVRDPSGWIDGLSEWVPALGGVMPGDRALLVARLPVDAVGQGLRIDGVRSRVRWLPAPELTIARLGDGADLALGPPDSVGGMQTDALADLLGRDACNRWRARLLTGELDESSGGRVDRDGLRVRAQDETGEITADEAINAWAEWRSDIARESLARVWRAGRFVHKRLVEGLCGSIEFSGGRRVPVWETDADRIDAVFSDILSAGTDEQVLSAVSLWASETDRYVPWIVSDAVDDGAEFRASPLLAVANLSGEPGRVRTRPRIGPGVLDQPVPPRSVVVTSFEQLSPDGRDVLTVIDPDLHEQTVTSSSIVGVTPPGLRVGSFASDWTVGGWLEARVLPDVSTRFTVLRVGPVTEPVWRLLIECDARDGPRPDRVRVRLNQEQLELSRYGELPANAVRVERDGVWAVMLDLDVGPGEPLALGMERIRPDGSRSAWPRPMLPWQERTPVMLLDLSVWDDG